MGKGRVAEINRNASEHVDALRAEISELRDQLVNLKAGLNLYEPLRRLKSDLEAQTEHLGNSTMTRENLSEAIRRVLENKSYSRPLIPIQYVQPGPPPEFPKRVIRYNPKTGQPLELATVFDLDAGVAYSRDGWMQSNEHDWKYAVNVLGSEGPRVWSEINEAGQQIIRTEGPEPSAGKEKNS